MAVKASQGSLGATGKCHGEGGEYTTESGKRLEILITRSSHFHTRNFCKKVYQFLWNEYLDTLSVQTVL